MCINITEIVISAVLCPHLYMEAHKLTVPHITGGKNDIIEIIPKVPKFALIHQLKHKLF